MIWEIDGNRSSHTFLDPQVAGEFHMAKKSCKEQGWDVGGIDEILKQDETGGNCLWSWKTTWNWGVNKFGVPGNSKRPSVETRSNHPPQKLREIAGILLNKTNQSPFPTTIFHRSNTLQPWTGPVLVCTTLLLPGRFGAMARSALPCVSWGINETSADGMRQVSKQTLGPGREAMSCKGKTHSVFWPAKN